MSASRDLARVAALLFAAAAVTAIVVAGASVYGQVRETRERAVALTGGDPERGRALMPRYGCLGCHAVPGAAAGTAGPPLTGMGNREYVGGVLANTPANLVAWIVDPRAIDPMTAMPVTGIGPDEARDVAAYLYTLR